MRDARKQPRTMWIAWEDDTSIRSRVLAEELGSDYHAFTRFTDSRRFGWLRYPVAWAQTAWTLLRVRPDVLVVQNPSIVLAFQAALLRPLLRYTLAIDLHTPFGRPTGIAGAIANALHEYGLRHSDAVIVTNEPFRQRVARTTDSPVLVLPDRIPDLDDNAASRPLDGAFNVLYICTFSTDEPWREVIAAAALVSPDTRIYISGRSRIDPSEVPETVILTGYLPRTDYIALLRSVDAVMVLTTAEENLVCGGYEAVAAEKPLILSDTQALRALFRTGTVFTRNEPEQIARAIAEARAAAGDLTRRIAHLKTEMATSWASLWATVRGTLGVAPPAPAPALPAGVPTEPLLRERSPASNM